MSSLSTLPKGDSAWLLRKAVERIMQQISVLETNIGSSTTGNSANTEIIFNDAGTLRGDAGLTYNKATDTLTVLGNVGIGVTPSAWQSPFKVIELLSGSIASNNTASLRLVQNAFFNSGAWLYKTTAAASRYEQDSGGHYWSTAPSGTAGNAVTFATAMTLDAPGSLGVGGVPAADFRLTSIGAFATGKGGAYIETGEFNRYGLVVNNANAGATTNIIEIRKASVALAAFTASGNLAFGNALGVDFSATPQPAGMTSELLNDYEEGTFTPTIAAASGTPTTTTVNSAVYTKIGRIVVVQIDISIINKGTASSSLIFSLPFNQTAAINTGAFRETSVTGFMGVLGRNGTTDAFASMYDNTTPWVNGYRIAGTYTYYV